MTLKQCILRALNNRCPRCGEGRLKENHFRLKEKCFECELKIVENPGDGWAFFVLLDRALFIFPIVAFYYFGLSRIPVLAAVAFAVLFLVLFIWFTPQRMGVALAIEFWIREGRKNG